MCFETEVMTTVYKFDPPLKCQPDLFVLDEEQIYFVVASKQDGLQGNIGDKPDVDLDSLFGIGLICDVTYDYE